MEVVIPAKDIYWSQAKIIRSIFQNSCVLVKNIWWSFFFSNENKKDKHKKNINLWRASMGWPKFYFNKDPEAVAYLMFMKSLAYLMLLSKDAIGFFR